MDANLTLFQFLLSDEGAHLLYQSATHPDPAQLSSAKHIFSHVAAFRKNIIGLGTRPEAVRSSPQHTINQHYLSIRTLQSYLATVSRTSDRFTITPYSFTWDDGNDNLDSIQTGIENPPTLFHAYVSKVVDDILAQNPRCIGISCIGQEQLFFSLLFGYYFKLRANIPIILGGTVFARILEKSILPSHWFGTYFDGIVRNEGEKPLATILHNVVNGLPFHTNVLGIAYCEDHNLRFTRPERALSPREVPVPDFSDLPLDRYLSLHVTLPILSSRGCYWGKCEFCHHGMVYGDSYSAYSVQSTIDTIEQLHRRYGVRHFAFNDEAIPPTVLRKLGKTLPSTRESGFTFTGLIKFERYYTAQDFVEAYRIGFRSLYVGLESASERVLNLMKKPNSIDTIRSNLSDATAAGIWMHCFVFFGFPLETKEDATETLDFVLENSGKIASFGGGAFDLKHNAPIMNSLKKFGVETLPNRENSLSVYYQYRVASGITPEEARQFARRLYDLSRTDPQYAFTSWIPREHLLVLLSTMTPTDLLKCCRVAVLGADWKVDMEVKAALLGWFADRIRVEISSETLVGQAN